jgi:hypothetical protein
MRCTAPSPERGGTSDLDLGRRICTTAEEELARVLQRVDVLALLGQNKGRVRFLGWVDAHACRGREQRGSRAATFHSSPLQIPPRVSSSPFGFRVREWVSVFWEGEEVVCE